VLLDHCIPRPFERSLTGHDVRTTREMRLHELKNGALLRAAVDAGFAAFVTMDAGSPHQQELSRFPSLITIQLSAQSNKVDALVPLAPRVLVALATLSPGSFVRIAGD
jgi:hypothetical protein